MRGRIRTIKPEAFLDEELWDLEIDSGLPIFRAFFGLVCFADREGRFEWRPRALKAVILPYWEGDFSRVLDACATRGLLVKYASNGRDYGYVRTFKQHQVINNRETASTLPEPAPAAESATDSGASTRAPRVTDACATRQVHAQAEREREGKGREGEGEVDAGHASASPHLASLKRPEEEVRITLGKLAAEAFGKRPELTVPGWWWRELVATAPADIAAWYDRTKPGTPIADVVAKAFSAWWSWDRPKSEGRPPPAQYFGRDALTLLESVHEDVKREERKRNDPASFRWVRLYDSHGQIRWFDQIEGDWSDERPKDNPKLDRSAA